jgi:hypothetical protein
MCSGADATVQSAPLKLQIPRLVLRKAGHLGDRADARVRRSEAKRHARQVGVNALRAVAEPRNGIDGERGSFPWLLDPSIGR